MNALDIAIMVILGFTLIRGIFTGLLQSVSGLIGSIAGFYTAYNYSSIVGEFLKQWITPGLTLTMISFFSVFVAVLLIVTLTGHLLKFLLKITFLGWVDKTAGAVFGLIKGSIIISILLIITPNFIPKNSHILKQSQLAPYFSTLSETMVKLVPKDMGIKLFKKNIKSLNDLWEKTKILKSKKLKK